ncbi:RDD family protein [Streptomyces sp. NBC_01198]|uniref:RDD family protein n=1 Tax=Streptomyces sp. NBC_01198 TaxID=2903769 RepID=UPI002E12B753|nr:RDD family protein [Streptomyces sp. NBC_01198]
MSAPPSGSPGSSPSASPAPGYYPDPSIPNYIRYWDGSGWVPGTSRPAPEGSQPAAAQPAVDESGPMFLDADPAAPAAVQGVPETPPPAPAPASAPVPSPAAEPAPAPAWPAAAGAPGTELPPISWGAPGSQPSPQPSRPAPAAEAEYRPPHQQPRVTPQPARPEPAVPAQTPAPWAEQVHELAREGVAPWRPVPSDPFGSSRSLERPGGLLLRFAARVVDTVVFAAVTGAAAVPLGSAAYQHAKDKVDAAKLTGETVKVWLLDATTGAELGAVLLVALLAGVLLEVLPTARWGRTLGKKLVGLKVLDIEAQQPPAFGASLRRWLTRTVLNLFVVGVVGVAWCLFDRPWRQGWHDKAAHTFVSAT